MEVTLKDNPKKDNLETPTLCLNMIVKNESRVIIRMLETVVKIVDCYCICDTGSTDNTIELIESFFKKHGIPGKITNEPFKDFCHNRNFSLNKCVGMSDYVLLMDADMILEVGKFDKNVLKLADTLSILQGNTEFYYQNIRIVKNNGKFKYIGVTHEYLDSPPGSVNYPFTRDALFINDIGDGGAKSDKVERDIRLLTKGLEDEPDNGRYHFYLANTYYGAGDFKKAIELYRRRITLDGWEQEKWYSYYRIGSAYQNMKEYNNAVMSWLDAYEYFPFRVENLYEIIEYYKSIQKYKLAKKIYDMAVEAIKKNTINTDFFLFFQNDIYTHKLSYSYSLFASYIGDNMINDQIVNILNGSKDESIVQTTLLNMKYYQYTIESNFKYDFTSSLYLTINNERVKLYFSSSCLIPKLDGDGYLMNIRLVNYRIKDNGEYYDCDKHITSSNKYIEFTKDFKIVNEKVFDVEYAPKKFLGVEDVRIYYDNSELTFIGVTAHSNNTIGVVGGKYDINKNILDYDELKPAFINSECEKNWVFVNYKGSTHVVYNWFPLKLCKINNKTKQLILVEEKNNLPGIFRFARGSTCGFEYKNEFWFILHIVSYEKPRHYYHIIAVFDKSMNLSRYSAPFKFEGEPIEYCVSLVVENERVLINYSTWDRTSKIAVYDKKYIDDALKYNYIV
jgi:tetratricopeptide (TPR) repeat protein